MRREFFRRVKGSWGLYYTLFAIGIVGPIALLVGFGVIITSMKSSPDIGAVLGMVFGLTAGTVICAGGAPRVAAKLGLPQYEGTLSLDNRTIVLTLSNSLGRDKSVQHVPSSQLPSGCHFAKRPLYNSAYLKYIIYKSDKYELTMYAAPRMNIEPLNTNVFLNDVLIITDNTLNEERLNQVICEVEAREVENIAPQESIAPMQMAEPEMVATQEAPSQAVAASQDVINECRVYKQLLDDGIITQEEFEEKKKQLLEI